MSLPLKQRPTTCAAVQKGMDQLDLHKAEELARQKIKNEHRVTPKQFVTGLKEQGVREHIARVAMWDLIDRHEVTLSLDRLLTMNTPVS